MLKIAVRSGTAAIEAALGDYAGSAIKRLAKTMAGPPDMDEDEMLKLGKQCYDNIRDYGAPHWYDWCLKNWSTKWPAYNQGRAEGDYNTIIFDTAWSGVPEFIRKLSEKYPGVMLEYTFADEDRGSNVGAYEFERGEITFENCPPSLSAEALRIAEIVLGEDDWEDDCEDEYGDEAPDDEDELDGEESDDWGDEDEM